MPTQPPNSDGDSTSRSDQLAERVASATSLLEEIVSDRALLAEVPVDERNRLLQAAGRVSRPDVIDRRRLLKVSKRKRKQERVQREESVLSDTGIRRLRREPVFVSPRVFPPAAVRDELEGDVGHASGDARQTPEERSIDEARHCYVCKRDYTTVHHFYDHLCPECAELNFRKRTELADLSGRVALLTGGRVKIGYQAGIKLLRAGAHVIVTTRFPRDSAARYAREEDFEDWRDRLEVYGLDLRSTPDVELFCRDMLQGRDRLDFIINNACQTVRRPAEFYEHMRAGETAALGSLSANVKQLLRGHEERSGHHGLQAAALPVALRRELRERLADGELPLPFNGQQDADISVAEGEGRGRELDVGSALFPAGKLDQDLQQVDLRGRNSWRLQLDEVATVELLEVHLVNAVAPYVLNARLKSLMMRTPERDKHIVNVSAVEGQFYRSFKTTRHPHTNMAKAALNMMTRTSAADYAASGIHMNSVDTGWITDEDPLEIAERKTAEHRFHPPLDIVDGAARIVDPIISGWNSGIHIWGQFLKDYRPAPW